MFIFVQFWTRHLDDNHANMNISKERRFSNMTNHSIIRTEERAHKSEKAARRMINLAKERGIKASDFPARERRYLEGKGKGRKKAVYYAGYCFIFSNDFECITMFSVPQWFGKKTNFQGKQRIRDIKKYVRNNPDVFDRIERFCIA